MTIVADTPTTGSPGTLAPLDAGQPAGPREAEDLGFPPCPPWCAEHFGGEREVIPAADGYRELSIVTSRLHERVVFDEQFVHGDLIGETVPVRVLLERCDDPGEIIDPTSVVVDASAFRVAATPA